MSSDRIITYPTKKLIIENLEANKRLELVAGCPTMQAYDKSIPMHFEFMELHKKGFKFNDKDYSVERQNSKDLNLTMWDVSIDGEKEATGDFPTREDAIRSLLSHLLGGRTKVHVKILKIQTGNVLFPDGFKLYCTNLINSQCDIRRLLPFIHESSKVHSLQFRPTSRNELNLPIVKSCDHLEIIYDGRSDQLISWTKNLEHRHTKLITKLTSREVVDFVKGMVESNGEHGTTRFLKSCEPIDRCLKRLKDAFGEQCNFWNSDSIRILVITINANQVLLVHEQFSAVYKQTEIRMIVKRIGSHEPAAKRQMLG